MPETFKLLSWDSDFFNLKVAELEKNLLSGTNRKEHLQSLIKEGVELAYYTTDVPIEEDANSPYSSILVNEKVSVRKDLLKPGKFNDKVSLYDEKVPTKELIALAQRAGKFSRFNADPNIDTEKIMELYKIWITRSTEKIMASDVLVYKNNEGIIHGFVTIRLDGKEGQIPLLAVSREAEGKGVSFALMQSVDSLLFNKGCHYYKSTTQADNRPAVTVFKRHGIKIKPVEYVYHLWRK